MKTYLSFSLLFLQLFTCQTPGPCTSIYSNRTFNYPIKPSFIVLQVCKVHVYIYGGVFTVGSAGGGACAPLNFSLLNANIPLFQPPFLEAVLIVSGQGQADQYTLIEQSMILMEQSIIVLFPSRLLHLDMPFDVCIHIHFLILLIHLMHSHEVYYVVLRQTRPGLLPDSSHICKTSHTTPRQ